jgi:eukaryotic-like serine/threonine-protein kinase
MALTARARLGPYEIRGTLGVGGMGEVYRATDTNLKRAVAIKVLPESVATDRDRLARFQREAEVLASLNHPNVAAVYGLERSGGVTALVMELVEGPTLADRIAQGPIPIDEALPIAKQIAEALEAAHEQSIIHRDLKPANIKLRPDGTVKVLDFGLAKALEPASSASVNASASPTITSPAMTGVGVLLGTAAYMSPEQARGKAVDTRSDIWAFGCVLYEMLTAKRAFEGDEVSLILAKVIERQPDFGGLPLSTPPSVRRVITRCLEKDVKRRLRDIGDVGADLDEAAQPTVAASFSARPPGTRPRSVLPAAVGAICGGLLTGVVLWWVIPPSSTQVQYFAVGSQVGENPWTSQSGSVAISPDGGHVAYLSIRDGVRQLRVWAVDLGSSTTLVADGLPSGPFFSPDGEWLGFFDEADTALKRVPVRGGVAQVICRFATALRGASWGLDGSIVFAISKPSTGLLRVPASGGTPEALTSVGEIQSHRWPSILPGGRAVLFTTFEAGVSKVAVLNLDTGAQTVVVPNGTYARYADSGHIVFGGGGGLRAVKFDINRLETLGSPISIVDGLLTTAIGLADFGISSSGSLVYVPAGDQERALGWVDRSGHITPLLEGDVRYPRLSPDDTRVALAMQGRAGPGIDIWIHDLARGSAARLTFEGQNLWPVWTPDGAVIAFGSNRTTSGSFDMYSVAADFSGEARRLADTAIGLPGSWAPGAKTLVYSEFPAGNADGNADIWMLLANAGEARPFLATRFSERAPRLSPDGRWLAYVSDHSGESRVYVQPFPNGGQVFPVSTGRGTEPVWSRDGSTLFYRNANQLLEVNVTAASTFTIGQQQVVFTGAYDADLNSVGQANYDVSLDGERFLMVGGSEEVRPPALYVQNWFEELKRLVPAN